MPLVACNASLGFSDLSIEISQGLLLRMAGRSRHLANLEAGDFQCLHGLTVLFELNPVPGDGAIAVSYHDATAL